MPAQPEEIAELEEPLIQAYRQAWSDVVAQQQSLLDDPQQAVKRQRLAAIRDEIEGIMEEMDASARAWIQSNLPQVFGLGAAGGAADAGVGEFVWNNIAQEAVQRLATQLYDSLKNAHQFVNKTTRELISSVVRDQSLKTAIQGRTATDADREMRRLLEEKGIHAVRYADGSKHGLDEYSRMAIRTETAKAYNSGTLQGAGKDCQFFQIADGPECGLSFHDDPTLALGMVVDRDTAAQYLISHPNCRRAFGPRPDILTKEQAKTAESFITPEQTKAQRAADQAKKAQQRRVAQSKARVARREANKAKTLTNRESKITKRADKLDKERPLSPNVATEADIPLAPHGQLPAPGTVLSETAVSKVPTIAQLIDKGWDPAKAEAEYTRLLKNARNVDRRARDKLLGRKPGSDVIDPQLDPIQKLINADAGAPPDVNPLVLHDTPGHQSRGAGKAYGQEIGWERRLLKDTAPGEYIPVRKLEVEGYTIKDGIAVRRQGITYVLETPPGSVVTDAMKAELEGHVTVAGGALETVPSDVRGFQKGMAVTRGQNPSDAFWAKEFGKPDFKSSATGGQGRTVFWNTQPRPGVVLHEFGHSLDDALHVTPGGGWEGVQKLDLNTGAFHADRQFQGSIFGHDIKPGNLGATTYGAESASEDFAESVRLYMADRKNGFLGYTKLDGANTSVRFADVFPERAAFLDNLMGVKTSQTAFQTKQLDKALQEWVDNPHGWTESGLQLQFGISGSQADEIIKIKGPEAVKAAEAKALAEAAAKAQVEAANKVLTKADLSFSDKTGIGVKKSNAIKKAKAQGYSDQAAQAIGVEVERAEIELRLKKMAAEGKGVLEAAQSTPVAGSVMRGYNSATNSRAGAYLNEAGRKVDPLAVNAGGDYVTGLGTKVLGQGQQAKANIAAQIAGRLNNDKDWAVFRSYQERQIRGKWEKTAFRPSEKALSIKKEVAELDRAGSTRAGRQALLDKEVSARVQDWAQSSGDSRLNPVTMQRAIKEEFGTTGDYLVRSDSAYLSREDVDANYAQAGEFFRRVARRMYENTQDDLKAAGITHVSVYRGMNFKTKPEWMPTGYATARSTAPKKVRPLLQPANSWSVSQGTSAGFGKIMFRAEIPAERILGSARSGFGCLGETEFVVLDSEGLIDVYKYGA